MRLAEGTHALDEAREVREHGPENVLQPLVFKPSAEGFQKAARQAPGAGDGLESAGARHGVEELQRPAALKRGGLREHARHRGVEQQAGVRDAVLGNTAAGAANAAAKAFVPASRFPRLGVAPGERREEPREGRGLGVGSPSRRQRVRGQGQPRDQRAFQQRLGHEERRFRALRDELDQTIPSTTDPRRPRRPRPGR